MKHLVLSLVAAALALGASSTRAEDVGALLKAADKYRLSSENMQVDTLISVFNSDGTPDKERRYLVYAQTKHQSLVLMQSPAEKGQKVLMLGDDFWLLMPGSQRPLRITPMQKLLGDASTGDIATLTWAEDYTGSVAGEEPCGEPAQPCLHLSLQATRKGVTYQRIELWLGKARHEPVRADLYVQSDKLAKRARFVMDKPAAPTAVTEMLLLDELTSKRETQVRYLGRKERTVPEAWLNPMFLARNPALE
ncbi:MAG TPA: outer membrane lipoprotein-sorting protein [Caldimonas sp.]|nr:outer membrane lipoprotein-sorting protein [Caldimonas sp.]